MIMSTKAELHEMNRLHIPKVDCQWPVYSL